MVAIIFPNKDLAGIALPVYWPNQKRVENLAKTCPSHLHLFIRDVLVGRHEMPVVVTPPP
jgi:hypothetical protein